jgi:hypothetical protein
MKSKPALTVQEADEILEAQTIYRYNSEWNIAICTRRQHAVAAKTLLRHTNENHHISHCDYKPVLDALQTKSLPYSSANFPHPPNGIPAIPSLKVYDGFDCSLCDYLTTSKISIRNHATKHSGVTDYSRPVKLQV